MDVDRLTLIKSDPDLNYEYRSNTSHVFHGDISILISRIEVKVAFKYIVDTVD